MRDSVPSETAMLVARSLLLAAEDERLRELVAKGEVECLRLILGEGGGWFGLARRRAWARGLFFKVMNLMVPGIVPHYAARKRRIELAVRDGLAGGAGRVVILGAGFDTLAWRLHGEFPKVEFLELDHPATQGVKQRAFGGAANFSYGPLDLAVNSPAEVPALLDGRGTIFIAEGLTMYLREHRVATMLRELSSLAGKAGRVIFTFMEADGVGSFGFRGQNPVVAAWLKLRSEPFLWGIRRDQLPGFLEDCGLGSVDLFDALRLREEILAPRGLGEIPLAVGECLCLCSPLSK